MLNSGSNKKRGFETTLGNLGPETKKHMKRKLDLLVEGKQHGKKKDDDTATLNQEGKNDIVVFSNIQYPLKRSFCQPRDLARLIFLQKLQ